MKTKEIKNWACLNEEILFLFTPGAMSASLFCDMIVFPVLEIRCVAFEFMECFGTG